MSNSLCGALTKSGRVFVATSRKKIGKEIQRNKIARHNVLFYLCRQEGKDGEITIKQENGRKVKFKPNSAQIETLRERCRQFFALS